MPDDSNWKTPIESPFASIAYVFGSSTGIFSFESPPTSWYVFSITSRFRRPRKSIFRRPSASTSHIPNCVTTSWSAPFCWSGTYSTSGRSPMTTPAAWIESLRTSPSSGFARSTISRTCGSESYACRSSAPGVRDRGPREHGAEGDDLGDPVATVLLLDVVDDPVAAGDGEVDVHVGHGLAARVEEALEQEVVPDRVDVRDLERVGGDGSRGRSSTRADLDAVLLREADEVPDDQEVVREAHLLDRLQLEPEAILELWRDGSVPLLQAFLAELGEVVERVAVVRRWELRQPDLAELELDIQPFGDLDARPERVWIVREVGGHLGGRLEIELIRVEAPPALVLQRVAGLDAEQRLVGPRVLVAEVVDVAGRDEREA